MKEINPEKLIAKFPKDLQKQIGYLEKKGFVVTQQKEGVAKLEKIKKYRPLLALILFLCGVAPGLIYTLHFIKTKTHTIILDIENQE